MFRPITAAPCGPTQRLSHLVDILLRPFISCVSSYISERWKQLSGEIHEDVETVTFNLNSSYSNISHDSGIEALAHRLNQFRDLLNQRFTKEYATDNVKCILNNNSFNFNGDYYLQKLGTAMRTMHDGPSILVMGVLEISLYKKGDHVWKWFQWKISEKLGRYLDDCFLLWPKKNESVVLLLDSLNGLHPNISFTMEANSYRMPFLDILVLKEGSSISTDIFRKASFIFILTQTMPATQERILRTA